MSDFCLKVRLFGGTVDCKGVDAGLGVDSVVEFGVALAVAFAVAADAALVVLASTASLSGAQAMRPAVHANRITSTRAKARAMWVIFPPNSMIEF